LCQKKAFEKLRLSQKLWSADFDPSEKKPGADCCKHIVPKFQAIAPLKKLSTQKRHLLKLSNIMALTANETD